MNRRMFLGAADPAGIRGMNDPKANAAGAQRFADWLVGDEAQGLIAEFGRTEYGAQLFFANAGAKVRPPGL